MGKVRSRISARNAALWASAAVLSLMSWASGCRGTDRDAVDRSLVGSEVPNLLQSGRLRNAPVDSPAPPAGWVLYAFSPGSPACAQNAPNVARLAASLQPGWALLAVAVESRGLPRFLERFHVTLPVLMDVPLAELAKLRVTATPRTYILDPQWKVLEVLDGPFEGSVASRLVQRLHPRPGPRLQAGAAAAPAPQNDPDLSVTSTKLCLDAQQRPYSPGAVATALGTKLECKPGGTWASVS
jgi:hypothetical protein